MILIGYNPNKQLKPEKPTPFYGSGALPNHSEPFLTTKGSRPVLPGKLRSELLEPAPGKVLALRQQVAMVNHQWLLNS